MLGYGYGRANMGEKKAGPRPFLTKIGGEFSFSDVFPASNSWPEMRNSCWFLFSGPLLVVNIVLLYCGVLVLADWLVIEDAYCFHC